MEATKRLLLVTFGYGSDEAQGRVNVLDYQREIPTENEIEDDQESVVDMLKVGLFDTLPEEYIVIHGKDEFDKWIGPFIRSILDGHTDATESYEHLYECTEDRFCPTKIIRCYARDRMNGELEVADEAYIAYGDEMVHMNIKIVQELLALKAICLKEAEDLLEDYQWYLESVQEFPIGFDESLFHDLVLE